MSPLLGKALPPGGTIGIVAPASPYTTYSDVLRGIAWWEAKGYRVFSSARPAAVFVGNCGESARSEKFFSVKASKVVVKKETLIDSLEVLWET